MADYRNRFRFTGSAKIPPAGPVQGTAGMSVGEMQAAAKAAQEQHMLAEMQNDPEAQAAASADFARMQHGQAAYEPSLEELEAQELMARQVLGGDMSKKDYKKALIELLFGGWNTSGLQK